MSPEHDKQLCEKYPVIFQNRNGNLQETAMCWGFACGDGWYDLIDTLCRAIDFHLKHNAAKDTPPFVCDQVKEKYGTLRFYGHGGDKTIWNYITFAELFSGRICETCGKPGKTVQSTGWWYTACDEHTRKD